MKTRQSILIIFAIVSGWLTIGLVSGVNQIALGQPLASPFQEPASPTLNTGGAGSIRKAKEIDPSTNFDLSKLPVAETVRRSTVRVPTTTPVAPIEPRSLLGVPQKSARLSVTNLESKASQRLTSRFVPAQAGQLILPGPASDGEAEGVASRKIQNDKLRPAQANSKPSPIAPTFNGTGPNGQSGFARLNYPSPIVLPPSQVLPQQRVVHATGCPCGCQPQCTTATVYVPVWETRFMNVMQTCYRSEIRQQKYRTTHVVYDDVPQVESYSVDVPQQRTRTFTENRREEYQVPVNENFTVMVQKPQQRKVLVDREEAYEVPVETPYTVMVPQRKNVQETKYKTVFDKEPRQVRYTVNVPKERTRIEVEYVKQPFNKTVRVAKIEMVEERRRRPKVEYVDEVQSLTIKQPYVVYVDDPFVSDVEHFRYVEGVKDGKEPTFSYQDKTDFAVQTDTVQTTRDADKTIDYKISVPYVDRIAETYYENEPYEETISKTFPIRIQTPRQVTKTYQVRIPVTEHVSRPFTVEIPYEIKETAYRTVIKQVPVTKYRTITRDMGCWKREVYTTPNVSIFQDACGSTTCMPGVQTCQRNVWCPQVVTQRIPYTDYQNTTQRLAYQVPKLLKRTETRMRKVPVTQYKVETRSATLDVLDFQQSTRTEDFKVTKYRWKAKTRMIDVKRVREETRQKTIPFVEFQETSKTKRIPYTYRLPIRTERDVKIPFVERQKFTTREKVNTKRHEIRWRDIKQNVTVRVAKPTWEYYTVKVPIKRFIDKQVTEYVDVPKTKEIKYTEMVPEIRTRTEYVSVERKVPVYETKTVTELVPQIKTRSTTRTATRTVEEYKIKTFMVMVPEVRTRKIFKTKYRDVPVMRSEVYWENVPETRNRIRWVKVPRKIQREHVRDYTVQIPYQVRVAVPFKTCRMVPKTISVPVEPVCQNCVQNFGPLHSVSAAYLDYGVEQVGQGIQQVGEAWDRIVNH
ncbi:MAG: hypothetical protein P8J27_10875 [Mariniblastus sp.]|nr:hypothetical protein [Mariniblastus sp.]